MLANRRHFQEPIKHICRKRKRFSKTCRMVLFVQFQGALMTQAENSGLLPQTENFVVLSLNQREKYIGQ